MFLPAPEASHNFTYDRAHRAEHIPESHIHLVKVSIAGNKPVFAPEMRYHSNDLLRADGLGPALPVTVDEKASVRKNADQAVQDASAVRAHEKNDLAFFWRPLHLRYQIHGVAGVTERGIHAVAHDL